MTTENQIMQINTMEKAILLFQEFKDMGIEKDSEQKINKIVSNFDEVLGLFEEDKIENKELKSEISKIRFILTPFKNYFRSAIATFIAVASF